MNTFKKRARLKNLDYIGHYQYFITICTHEKKPLFHNGILVRHLTDTLKTKSDALGFAVWAFCFMPDHVHLLLEGNARGSNLIKFVSSYKQSTAFYYKNSAKQRFTPAESEEDRAKALSYSTGPERCGRAKALNYNTKSQRSERDNALKCGPGSPPNARSVVQGFSPAKNQKTKLWQPSFYDHVLRKEEDILATGRYIFENPMRKNLVTHYREYQFMGSFEKDIEDFF